jgi:transposase
VTRHRRSRGGNRQAICVLHLCPHRIAFVRMAQVMAHEPSTRVYLERRVKEGRSKLEVMRILKRYVAREIYRHLLRG